MTTTAPTTTVSIAGAERRIDFTLATLLRVEQAMGLGVYEVVNRFRGLRPEARVLDGRRLGDEETAALDEAQRERLTVADEDRNAAVGRFKLQLAVEFCAGCLGMTTEAFLEAVPPAGMLRVLNSLQTGFLEAVTQLSGADEEVPTTPSAPGRGSGLSSACATESSAA